MNTAEKFCASIGMALIITALFTALYYYIYKQQMNKSLPQSHTIHGWVKEGRR